LTEERLNLDSTKRLTNIYSFDNGTGGGPGVLTKIGQTANSFIWSGVKDAFSRIGTETNSFTRQTAYGKLNGLANVSLTLDNVPLSFAVVGSTNQLWPYQWRATMELTAGAHRVDAKAVHTSGMFTTNATLWFTNNIGSITVTNVQDGNGNLTQRIWRKPNGTTNLVQTLAWDGRGRLYKVTERDSTQSGRNFTVAYDALGRRLRTTEIAVTNNIALTNSPLVTDHYFDPAVEFLELGVNENGKATWKLMGPDLDGRYGGQNGTGGFEAVASGATFSPVVADALGNVLATVRGVSVSWNSNRVSAYGGVPGYRAPAVGGGGGLGVEYAWRNRAVESIGMVWAGGNWLDPVSGRFIAFDPLGHDASDNGYSFCRGNPVGYNWDADGRLGKQWVEHSRSIDVNSVGSFFDASFSGAAGSVLQGVGSIPSVFGQAREGMAQANQEISTYTGGQAFLANTLRLPADFAFGTTALINDPLSTVPQIPGALAQLPGNISQSVQNFANNPSIYGAFNLVENGIQVAGLYQGAVSLYRAGSASLSTGGGSQMVQVTSWADAGITPDLNPGRWVQVGGPTQLNFLMTGLPGPKGYLQSEFPFFKIEGSKVPFGNYITDEVPASSVQWPQGVDVWRGIFRQRQLKTQ